MDTKIKVDRAPVTCTPARTDLPSLQLLLLVKAHAVVLYLKSELSCSRKLLMMKPAEFESKLVDAEGGDVDGDDVEEEGDHDSKGNDNGNVEKNHLKEDGDDDEEADDAANGQDDDDDDDKNSEDEVEEEPDDDEDEDEKDKDEEEDEDEEVQPPKKRKK